MTTLALSEATEINAPPRRRPAADEDVSFLPMSDVGADGRTGPGTSRPFDEVSRGYTLFERGDVLVAKITPCFENGKIAQAATMSEVAAGSTEFHVVRPIPSIADTRYVLHFLRHPHVRFAGERRMTGSGGQRRVPEAFLRELEIPLPPIEEQRRIAAVLDQADELRAKRQTSLVLLDSLNESLFLDMFGDPSTWAWAERPLIELVDPDRPISYGILKPGPHIEYGVPYVRVVDMRLGGVDSQSIKRTSPEISYQYRRSLLRPGDLLLSIRGHVGRLAEVPEELDGANITQDTARLAIKEADPRFVLQFLRTSWARRWMGNNVKGAAVRGINLWDVKRLPVPVFERSAQDEFVRRVRSAEGTALAQRRAGDGLDELFSSLQHRAFTGQL